MKKISEKELFAVATLSDEQIIEKYGDDDDDDYISVLGKAHGLYELRGYTLTVEEEEDFHNNLVTYQNISRTIRRILLSKTSVRYEISDALRKFKVGGKVYEITMRTSSTTYKSVLTIH